MSKAIHVRFSIVEDGRALHTVLCERCGAQIMSCDSKELADLCVNYPSGMPLMCQTCESDLGLTEEIQALLLSGAITAWAVTYAEAH